MTELRIFNSAGEVADCTFDMLKGAETAALSFGSTYEGIFEKWRELYDAGGRPRLPALFPADERLVDINDPGSNWGTARKSFIDHCGSSADRDRWASDADTYRRMLKDQFGEQPPVFEIIFLGLGPDGHTASLFPDSCPSEGAPAWNEPVLETIAPFNPPKRLSLGPGVIASARRVVLTVTGRVKAAVFETLMQQLYTETAALPPAKILLRRMTIGLKTEIFCDAAAGENLGSNILSKYRVEK